MRRDELNGIAGTLSNILLTQCALVAIDCPTEILIGPLAPTRSLFLTLLIGPEANFSNGLFHLFTRPLKLNQVGVRALLARLVQISFSAPNSGTFTVHRSGMKF